jgi:plasmid stabilization system protein ParE
MIFRVVVRPGAATDISKARGWYEQQRTGLGTEFMDCLEEVIEHLAENPRIFTMTKLGVQRALLDRFPYAVYFRVRADEVRLLACLHQHRGERTVRASIRRP